MGQVGVVARADSPVGNNESQLLGSASEAAIIRTDVTVVGGDGDFCPQVCKDEMWTVKMTWILNLPAMFPWRRTG